MLRERQDEGLGREIDRHLRAGLEGGRRRDVEDRTAAMEAMRDHQMAKIGQRANVSDHFQLASERELGELPLETEAGIVDQCLHPRPRLIASATTRLASSAWTGRRQ